MAQDSAHQDKGGPFLEDKRLDGHNWFDRRVRHRVWHRFWHLRLAGQDLVFTVTGPPEAVYERSLTSTNGKTVMVVRGECNGISA